ncbi:MAG: hypothetical protein EAZ55_14135 [Cytophagales bacterium]|nr:MAG: hypothetical protein EAZ55_14135 [Cytophagales bacterium]
MLLLLAVMNQAKAQTTVANSALVGTWKVINDSMSGMGKHQALAATDWIKFQSSGVWDASNAVEGFQSGSWNIDEKGNITLNEQKNMKAKITKEGYLLLQYKGKTFRREIIFQK